MADENERRRYRRVRAAILVRPLGPLARVSPRQVTDISLGGLRAWSDDARRVGTRLELELVFPDGGSATCLAEVVWAEPQPSGAVARYEMGLRFVEVDPDDLDRIAAVLED
ncbi:MAG TPA: PilZ domain-containing protein [Anaeromyxobacter sp.]|nr:PilZ domain-containing protein [Anaeromyxobacter sp.]